MAPSGYHSRQTLASTDIASAIWRGFGEYSAEFASLTDGGIACFQKRKWAELHALTVDRLDLYERHVSSLVEQLQSSASATRWTSAKANFAEAHTDAPLDIATTFFNSVTRRIFQTVGVDDTIEFAEPNNSAVDTSVPIAEYDISVDFEASLRAMLVDRDLGPKWRHLKRDVTLAAQEIRTRADYLDLGDLLTLVVAAPVFYRGRSAYIVGSMQTTRGSVPVAFAIHHTVPGLAIGAVLLESSQLSALFSYTRAAFFVRVTKPGAMVSWLRELLPHRDPHELYSAIGYRKHGKTELFQDIVRCVDSTEHRFTQSRGVRGLVMIVFDLEGLGVVFKVIRDRFPYPKRTTRRAIEAKYRQVHRHDRAGRMIDAYNFSNLRLPVGVFSDQLLEELRTDATRCVAIDDDFVTLQRVYVERKVVPLDIYVREANPIKAEAAIIDYGRAIKNLASANIFPGDMLLKNFGVTHTGRVVFYDYDELCKVTECRFREIPVSTNADDDMSADPWFSVGDNDVFPEEFERFLGVRGELRQVFEFHHGDLWDPRFWRRAQERATTGESIEVFPYEKSARLGASTRANALSRMAR